MVNLPSLDIYDNFGMSVSLNSAGDMLAVGATSDDGLNNLSEQNVGAVYLFRFASPFSADELTFGSVPGGLTTLSASELVAQLNVGTSVTLQANNDITVSSPINAGAGSEGTLSLLAGRNVRFDADVILGGRNLGVIANASAADGVLGAYRDAGQGGLSMVSGVSVQAGTFGVIVRGADTSISNPNSSPGSSTSQLPDVFRHQRSLGERGRGEFTVRVGGFGPKLGINSLEPPGIVPAKTRPISFLAVPPHRLPAPSTHRIQCGHGFRAPSPPLPGLPVPLRSATAGGFEFLPP